MNFVYSARAKQKIRGTLNEQRKIIVQDGKEILERKLKQFNLNNNKENVTAIERYFGIQNQMDLFIRIAKAKIDLNKLRELEDNKGNLVIDKSFIQTETRRQTESLIT